MSDIYILAAARTPMGGFLGSLSSVPAPQLAAAAIQGALMQAQIGAERVDELLLGCVLPAGVGQAPARQAGIAAGLPLSTAATTVNKVCGSGMKTLMLAHHQLLAQAADIIVAGGMENMSLSPYLLPKARQGLRMGHAEIKDSMFLDGLEDAGTARAMGSFAQETADERGLTRTDMDDFASASLLRAQKAQNEGWFAREIVPVHVSTRQGDVVVNEDEQPRSARIDKIPTLRPAFSKNGTLTAANSSSISDGASALVLARAEACAGLRPLARIVAQATHARHPSEFTLAPIGAIEKVLQRAAWSVADVDLFEINEAFAMVAMMPMHDLGIAHDKLNVHGGACALGHPLGSSGSRIVVTLLHALLTHGGRRGVAALCIGGGEATALAIELL